MSISASIAPPVYWERTRDLVDYGEAVKRMESLAAAIAESRAPEMVWLLEHPPLYTAGTSAREQDLIDAGGLPVYRTGRGGQFTYHGPGQRVAYVMLDLSRRGRDVRAFVCKLEQWLIDSLQELGVRGERRDDRVGVWVRRNDVSPHRDDKIAAIGVRVRRWVSYHGVSLNVEPDLSRYKGIIPCGVRAHGVTSLRALGCLASMDDVDRALKGNFAKVFGNA
jgi:lipoyl(octanoyl) transferase